MERDIIEIDEELCVGCGNCVPNCHQGALQVIDGKVRLLSDLMCEGLGACVGHCPTGAMQVSRREAEPYQEALVLEKMISGGPLVLMAHLKHLQEHKQDQYLKEALQILEKKGYPLNSEEIKQTVHARPVSVAGQGSCPGSQARSINLKEALPGDNEEQSGPKAVSELRQWPVQLHLLNPQAPYFAKADVLLASDCSAFTAGDFHQTYLKGKILAIACPKLDDGQESYVNKLKSLIDESKINTLTVLIMEVPCCRGLLALAQQAQAEASRKVPLKLQVLSLEGELLKEDWV